MQVVRRVQAELSFYRQHQADTQVEGMAQLRTCIWSFDQTMGTSFSTYLVSQLQPRIRRALEGKDTAVHVPSREVTLRKRCVALSWHVCVLLLRVIINACLPIRSSQKSDVESTYNRKLHVGMHAMGHLPTITGSGKFRYNSSFLAPASALLTASNVSAGCTQQRRQHRCSRQVITGLEQTHGFEGSKQ